MVYRAVGLTCVVGVGVLQAVRLAVEAGKTVVCDLQHKAVVHHAVRRLELPMGHNHTVVEEHHALEGRRVGERRRKT